MRRIAGRALRSRTTRTPDAKSGHDDGADDEVDHEDGARKALQSGAEDDGQQEQE